MESASDQTLMHWPFHSERAPSSHQQLLGHAKPHALLASGMPCPCIVRVHPIRQTTPQPPRLLLHSITAQIPMLPQCGGGSTAARSQKERDLLLLGER